MVQSRPTNLRRSFQILEVTIWLGAALGSLFACWFYSLSVPVGEGRYQTNWFLESGLWYAALVFPAFAAGVAIGAVRGDRVRYGITAFLAWLVVLFLWLVVGSNLMA